MLNDRADARFGRFNDELAELAGLIQLLTGNDAVTVSLTAALFNAIIRAGSREFDLMQSLVEIERPLLQLHRTRGGTCSTCG